MTDLGHISRREWARVIVFAAAVMLLTALPYVLGWLSQGPDWRFGGFLFGSDDGYSYLAKMRLGLRGDWLFTLRYTAEPHGGALLFLPYIALGKLTRLIVSPRSPDAMLALELVFHAARLVSGFALILVSYRFAAVFLRRPAARWLALVLITLGGGLGWLLVLAGHDHLLNSLPVDFFVPEDTSFLILFGLPHLALARACLLGGLLLIFRALVAPESSRAWLRYSIPAGLCWLVMGLCVPFYIAVVYLILGIWGLAAWARRRAFPWTLFWRTASAALIALPLLGYTGIVFLTNDVMGRWSAQNQLASPHPLHYVFGFAGLAIPAALALRWAWRRAARSDGLPTLLIAAWVVVMPVVVYLPVNVQRRLAEGVIVPLSILAVIGLSLWARHARRWRRGRAVLLAFALPTSLLFALGATLQAVRPDRPLFHPVAELRAMDTLNAIAPRDAVVLALQETSVVMPARTDLKTTIGHGPETLDWERKEPQVDAFFAGTLDDDARAALLAHVDYVFFGPLEQARARTPDPAWAADLIPLPDFPPGGPVIVYEVPHAAN